MLWPYEISHFTLAEVCNIPLFDLFGGANKSIEKRNDIYNICIICLPLGNNKSFPHHERWRPLVLQVDGGGNSLLGEGPQKRGTRRRPPSTHTFICVRVR
jgi:hypothetical protein